MFFKVFLAIVVAPTFTVYAFLPILKVALPALRPFTVTVLFFLFTVTFTIFFSALDNPETFVVFLTVNVFPTPTTLAVAAFAVIGAEFERKMKFEKAPESLENKEVQNLGQVQSVGGSRN